MPTAPVNTPMVRPLDDTDATERQRLVEHRSNRGELTPETPDGERFVAAAEALVDRLADAAGHHDRDRSYPFESLELVKSSDLPWASAPVDDGGWGLTSLHDLVVGAARIARGDPSLAIGLNMHLVAMDLLAHRGRCDALDPESARRARIGVARLTQGRLLVAAAISEHAQDLLRPRTRAERAGNEWVIDGRKAFCTMSPAADLLNVAVAFRRADGEERIGFVQLPTSTPGVHVEDDWDALGMRASGSHSVTFTGVRVGADQVQDAFPAGRAGAAWLDRYASPGLFHASAALGIAEAAHATVTTSGPDRRRARAEDPRALMLVADSAVDLAAMRSVLAGAARHLEHHRRRIERGEHPATDDFTEAMAMVQRAKAFVDRTAVHVVDRALELSGGSGYLAASPIARAWRDVRASAFMHPYGANRASSLIGAVELGQDPELG